MNDTAMNDPALRFGMRGELASLGGALADLCDRSTSKDTGVRTRTAAIIKRVRREGDAALFDLALELDGVRLESLEVAPVLLRRALARLSPALRGAMERSAANIAAAHRALSPGPAQVETEPGVIVGRRADPLGAVGVYAPGGRAAYPSSVLMGAVPARVAGVGTVVLCSPPGRDGLPAPAVLAAAALARVDRVFALGGAGAIAAMAFGTRTVPAVNRIVGPGNSYVAEAKLQVAGIVGIDSPAGPSELLVIADDSVDPAFVAREALAQAEHDPLAAVVIITIGAAMAREVERELAARLGSQSRATIIAQALESRGALLWCESTNDAVAFSNRYAPEHLLLAVRDPESVFADVRNAGSVFLGDTSSVAFGDYITGANHVLPTGGAARAYSGLSTLDFMRWTTYQRVAPDAAARLARDTAVFADAEGLTGHAETAEAQGIGSAGSRKQEAGIHLQQPGADPAAARRVAARRFEGMEAYDPRREPCAVDLSDNTNLWGAPPAAARALRDFVESEITRYPAVYAGRLKEALAEYAGVRREEIVTGCGSDDVLDSALRALAEPGESVAVAEPTFAMASIFARMNGLEVRCVGLTGRFGLDADALLATGARVIYICSPNNPTGNAFDRESIERVIRAAPGVVILDEAYAEFMGRGFLHSAPSHENLLVVRTLSKAFGLAGARVGYAAGNAALVSAVEKSRGPYKVSAQAERAALAALKEDRDWIAGRIDEVRANRERFVTALERLGLAPLASDANFVLVPVRDAAALAQRLRRSDASGVAVRPFVALPGIGDAVRITIGPWRLMETALSALEEAIQCA
ncbi:MAG TPA: histidinol dehydrogenase [Gemmatimonadaceae bacterium]|nr:histidinol dehydrogenase [Gemmatimonadaceae bacterium]